MTPEPLVPRLRRSVTQGRDEEKKQLGGFGMGAFTNIDWGAALLPDMPLLEIVVRGTLVYLGAFTLLRVILKREAGTLSITDLIVVVFLADAAQNAMAGSYSSVPDGIVLMAVIVFWAYALDRLAFHFPRFSRLIKPPPLLLVQEGRMMLRNMRREYITTDELMGQLRLQGIDDIAQVHEAYMESDGRISVIECSARHHNAPSGPRG